MKKYTLTKTDFDKLTDLKQQYLQQLARPLDGMWECFVTIADHYCILCENKVIGYFVINADQKLLQFSVTGAHEPSPIFSQVLCEMNVTGAFVSTGEFQYLSLCLDHQKTIAVKALMYHVEQQVDIGNATFPPQSQFRIVHSNELELAVDFGINTLGADPDWLQGYFGERIEREELFGLWQDNSLIATGECRSSYTQKPYADLGMVVSKDHRRQGLATNILRYLLHHCCEKGLRAICSTERENIAAQKVIAKSGFISHHRILEVMFIDVAQ